MSGGISGRRLPPFTSKITSLLYSSHYLRYYYRFALNVLTQDLMLRAVIRRAEPIRILLESYHRGAQGARWQMKVVIQLRRVKRLEWHHPPHRSGIVNRVRARILSIT